MGDEMDGCECIWSHEFAMQRLLALIRQSQNHCTDTDCVDVVSRLEQRAPINGGNESQNFVMMAMCLMIFLIMYFVRPSSFVKERRQGQGPPNNGPSAPPPPTPPAIH